MNNQINIKILGSVSPYCKGENNCPGYLVYNKKNKILLDCGNGITRNMKLPEDLIDLSIFITHLHKDHYADLFSLGYASYVYHNMGVLKTKIKVYVPKQTEENQNLYFDYQVLFSMKEQYFEFIEYKPDDIFSLDDIKISFFPTLHAIDCYAIKIENSNKKLIYTGDTGYKLDSLFFEFGKDANCFLIESSLLKSQNIINFTHLTAEEAALLAKKLNVKKLILTHFWPEIDKEEYLQEAKSIFPNSIVAIEGQIIVI